MSRTYVAVNEIPREMRWMPNSWGSQIIDRLHVVCGARYDDPLTSAPESIQPRIRAHFQKLVEDGEGDERVVYALRAPSQSTDVEAKADAATIRANRDKWKSVHDEFGGKGRGFNGTYDDFCAWIEEWCCWQEMSGGYTVE